MGKPLPYMGFIPFAQEFPHLFGNVPTGKSRSSGGEPAEGDPWAGYFAAAGFTNSTAQTAIADFYAGLSTDGIQSKVKAFVILGGEAATAKNVMQDAYHGALVNSPTFTPWVGVRSDGATSYGSTGTALSAITGITTDSTLIGVFAKQDAPANGANRNTLAYLYVETYTGPSEFEAAAITPSFKNLSGQEEYNVQNAVNDQFHGNPADAAWGDLTNVRLYSSRTGSGAVKDYRNSTEIHSSTTASETLPTAPMFFGAVNADGSPTTDASFATFDIWGYCIVEGLNGTDQALLDGRVATLRAALEALA